MPDTHSHPARRAGLLVSIRRDRSGNMLAIMAASLIPLLGFSGSAVDMARLYMVKSRLQQACDAGALAGRRAMTDTSLGSSALDATAKAQADSFFFNNFPQSAYGTTAVTFRPRKASVGDSTAANAVNATASADVPMTIMKVMGFTSQLVSVACQARFDVADTDVLFVLDTTGSMACLPSDSDSTCVNYAGDAPRNSFTRTHDANGVAAYANSTGYGIREKSNSRIEALRLAVLSFYDTFAANADKSTNVRYGFVTYASSVNVGQAILDVTPASLVGTQDNDVAAYQSRQIIDDYVITRSESDNGRSQSRCTRSSRSPASDLTYDTSTGNATRTTDVWSNNRCRTQTDKLGPYYEYRQLDINVRDLVAGNILPNPTKVRGQTMRWLGCVETPVEQPGQSTFTTTSLPKEIDPDARPQGDDRWFPHMQDLIYIRNKSTTNNNTYYTSGDAWDFAPGYGSDAHATFSNGSAADGEAFQKSGNVACGKPVKRLGTMTRKEVRDYVYANDFVPTGGTYHDVGMIWGTRLISPTGLWAADTAAWNGRNAPNRVIVFLTDGDMSPSVSSYGMYGMEGYDRRVGNGNSNTSNLTNLHNRRFLAACAGAKARNIDVWTVAIDTSASSTLQSCATTSAQALATTDGNGLSAAFTAIAKKLAMLRISQ